MDAKLYAPFFLTSLMKRLQTIKIKETVGKRIPNASEIR